jgi:subtilisin family serine protease
MSRQTWPADADVDAPEAWNTASGTAGTVVTVIDEGMDVSHPDLRNDLWKDLGEVPGNSVGVDESVYDLDPINCTGDEHGTHVVGTIAAEGNNGTGITSMNWQAMVMASISSTRTAATRATRSRASIMRSSTAQTAATTYGVQMVGGSAVGRGATSGAPRPAREPLRRYCEALPARRSGDQARGSPRFRRHRA